jgi:hypothetical protein
VVLFERNETVSGGPSQAYVRREALFAGMLTTMEEKNLRVQIPY